VELTKQLAELTREQLYEKVWSLPGSKLAEEFGLSDVAIAKRCKRLNIPRPSRGYWAKIQAGRTPRKTPLPPTPEETFVRLAEQTPVRRKLPPARAESLHPLAAELLQALRRGKPDYQQRVDLREKTLPKTEVSPALAERCAQSFHVILEGTEPVGIPFRKSQSSYDGGFFRVGHDRLYLEIEELLVEKPPDRRRRALYSPYGHDRMPGGRLCFRIKEDRYSRAEKKWTEGDTGKLEEILVSVVGAIRSHFVELRKKQLREVIEREKEQLEWQEKQRQQRKEEAVRKAAERRSNHAKAIRKVLQHRREDLLKAAEWWRLQQATLQFITDCEGKWKSSQQGKLEPKQTAWLDWAREAAATLEPSFCGYPDPDKDGPFAMDSIPFGGPYPETRDFNLPPTMPKIPKPKVVQQHYGTPIHAPQPYPFWLKYQGR
jgi:vacuolar-type H+-ATPase subunit H